MNQSRAIIAVIWTCVIAAWVSMTACTPGPATAPDRLKLWELVHDQCVPEALRNVDPTPCVAVDIKKGKDYAVLPDLHGTAQYLLIPTDRISGIESPDLLQSDQPNYWSTAWQARHFVFEKLGHASHLPIGLAINSSYARSQDQLHIHIDCVKPTVAAELRLHAEEIQRSWTVFPFLLEGHHYRARRMSVDELNQSNLFQEIRKDLSIDPKDMGEETLIIIGYVTTDDNEFIVLEDSVHLLEGDLAHGEDLLDAACSDALN